MIAQIGETDILDFNPIEPLTRWSNGAIVLILAFVAAFLVYGDARDNGYGRSKSLIWAVILGVIVILDLLAGILVLLLYYLVSRNKL